MNSVTALMTSHNLLNRAATLKALALAVHAAAF
jgi:hypothetical protein